MEYIPFSGFLVKLTHDLIFYLGFDEETADKIVDDFKTKWAKESECCTKFMEAFENRFNIKISDVVTFDDGDIPPDCYDIGDIALFFVYHNVVTEKPEWIKLCDTVRALENPLFPGLEAWAIWD